MIIRYCADKNFETRWKILKIKKNVLYYWNYSYICRIMKKVLFYLGIAAAIFYLNSTRAQDSDLLSGCKIAEQKYSFDCGQSNNDKLIFDICLENLYEDDSNDSEKKKLSSGNSSAYNTSLVAQNFSYNNLNTVFPTNLFFPNRTPLFILICVFRI